MVKNYKVYCFCSHLWVIFLSIDIVIDVAETSVASEADQHLEMGKQLLAKGQYSDALSHYHIAVEKDPSNYLTYYKRATVFLALGRSKQALQDLNSVIELKPEFTRARVSRGEVLLKQGKIDEAHMDFEFVLRFDPGNEQVLNMYNAVETLRSEVEIASHLIQEQRYAEAIEVLDRIVPIAPWNVELREMRSECYIFLGDLIKAIGDIRSMTKLKSDNTKAHMKLSHLHYQLGEADESLNQVRECLKLDPDHKECFSHYKKVKKLAKQINSLNTLSNEDKFDECIDKAQAALKTEPNEFNFVHMAKSKLCRCMGKSGQTKEAISVCEEALNMIPEDVNVLCDRAEAYITEDMLNEALQDFQTASQHDENSRRAQDGIKKVQKLIKQTNRRDYYKILGVKRTANKRDITKAYRKLARKWHPDNYQGDDKKKAEKKFIDIAAAKEVLTNPEKRQKFDNGEDPLDPESQHGQGFNPFDQGFNPFGHGFDSSGYTFKFHFN